LQFDWLEVGLDRQLLYDSGRRKIIWLMKIERSAPIRLAPALPTRTAITAALNAPRFSPCRRGAFCCSPAALPTKLYTPDIDCRCGHPDCKGRAH
jgi:hypothetical protein